VVGLQRHVVKKVATQIQRRREDKTPQSSGNMIRTCGNQTPNCLIEDNILHKGHTEVKNEKTVYVMARYGKLEQKCYPLPLSSH